MEERAVGGKDKKYVLYTVVNDDKARAGFGVWMVRILLGSLLLVALAVVPYVSLRLAQVNDRTLVVFQPVPMHNHSRNHHHKPGSHRPAGSSSVGSGPTYQLLQSASLVRENYTAEETKKGKKGANATIVTLHESAVTLSLLEDTNNASHVGKNQSLEAIQGEGEEMVVSVDEAGMNATVSPATSSPMTEESSKGTTSEKVIESKQDVVKKNSSSNQTVSPSSESSTSPPANKAVVDVNPTVVSTADEKKKDTNTSTNVSEGPVQEQQTSKIIQLLKASIATTTASSSLTTAFASTTKPTLKAKKTTTTTPKPSSPHSTRRTGILHKLAYVATAASGNHVGGICVWKTNKNVTKWSYFYDNIPIEFQSHQDNTDHEMRGLLAGVRLWSDQWHDYHVVLRSQHQAIEGSNHRTRVQLVKELDKMSEQHFTYELEWRQRKDDSLMYIAYSLARLHKNFEYWYGEFERHVNDLLGAQDWSTAKEHNRLRVPQTLFITDPIPESEEKIGDLTSLSLY